MIKIEIQGINSLQKKFENYPQQTKVKINAALNDWANRTSTDAKQLVSSNSSDTGFLKNSIEPEYGDGYAAVVAASKYAAYVEFGTRKFASQYVSSLPTNWQSYASTFKGSSGGSFNDFLKAITEWVKRKGIGTNDPENTAKLIVFKILREGVKARPFIYPSVNKNLPLLLEDIKKATKL